MGIRMSSDNKEKKEKKFRETVDTYTLIRKEDSGVSIKRKEDSGVLIKRPIGRDEDSGVRVKPKPTDKSEKKES
jgi:hypothetical protein